MKTQTMLAQLCALAVLVAPLGLSGADNADLAAQLGLSRYVEPVFPDAARLDGFSAGHVTVAVKHNARGEPIDMLVLAATHPTMAEAALRAVREWRFTPSSNPADLVTHTMRIGFRMQGVVVFPFGKNLAEDMVEAATGSSRLRESVTVPRVQALVRKPKALEQPMPKYPAALAPRQVEGTAAVRFYVDQDGRVRLPELIEATSPEFAEAALAAVAQWRYEPPQEGGRRIVATDLWTFKFAANN